MPAVEVVKVAAEKGIDVSVPFVHATRFRAKKAGGKSGISETPTAHGAKSMETAPHGDVRSPLEAAIEQLVEARVRELLKERLGSLLSR